LVPANPVAVRAPLEGVIKDILVRTNETVEAGQMLFVYDDAMLTSRLEVASEALRTAEAEERQLSQQALFDARARASLSTARGNVEEKRLEVDYLQGQLARNQVPAPRAGVALVGDPSEWIGRPVVAGQRILRIAEPDDREIEAWLPIGDAIRLKEGAPAKLYLSASPLSPVTGELRYVSYEALRRPDGSYAYRVRAALDGPTEHRAGLKGTVRLSGDRVPLIYWMLRRPLAAAREFTGF
jgi:multidrug resistance efflux pump